MGPISFWGNVVPRAFERIGGTILGSVLGLVALKLELISLPIMVLWCAVAMFLCGWLALGKRPLSGAADWHYAGGGGGRAAGRYEHRAVAKRRCYLRFTVGDAVYRYMAAAGVFLHWRIQMANYVTTFNRLYQAGFFRRIWLSARGWKKTSSESAQ